MIGRRPEPNRYKSISLTVARAPHPVVLVDQAGWHMTG
jgi:hypothetical protein